MLHDLPSQLVPTAVGPTVGIAVDACCDAATPAATPPVRTGSQRRRLWQLDAPAHCPVIGVCIPLAVLRRAVTSGLANAAASDDDYRIHCLAIGACKQRTPVSESLHKELERRYAASVRQAASAKCATQLAAWWRSARDDDRLPGALWATLTHPRCDSGLEEQVLAEVHMLQHQRGAAQRVDRARFDALQHEHAALHRQAQGLIQRNQSLTAEMARQAEQARTQAMQLRADLIGRDTQIAALRDELASLQAQVPALKSGADLLRRAELLAARVTDLERALLVARRQLDEARQPRDEAPSPSPEPLRDADVEDAAAACASPTLDDRAVLCVGGRPASVPLYRHIVERHGGRFLHHDGGDEESARRLEATLSAADVVICQTACISHGAYWRVKDYCKRHGKPCVFVDKPGSAGLRRALLALQS